MPLNDAACGQAPAKAKRIRVAVLVTRAAILSRFLLVAKVRFRRREKLTTPSGSWHSIGPRWQRRASSKNVSEKASIIIRLKNLGYYPWSSKPNRIEVMQYSQYLVALV